MDCEESAGGELVREGCRGEAAPQMARRIGQIGAGATAGSTQRTAADELRSVSIVRGDSGD